MIARWKARVEFLLSVIELFLSLTVEALQGKMFQNSLPSGGGRSLAAKISGEGVVPGEYVFGFYKTRVILLSDSPVCTVLRAVVLPACGGRTDGIAAPSTALAMRALRRAVKTKFIFQKPSLDKRLQMA